jgi:hypothetical protein
VVFIYSDTYFLQQGHSLKNDGELSESIWLSQLFVHLFLTKHFRRNSANCLFLINEDFLFAVFYIAFLWFSVSSSSGFTLLLLIGPFLEFRQTEGDELSNFRLKNDELNCAEVDLAEWPTKMKGHQFPVHQPGRHRQSALPLFAIIGRKTQF